MTLNLNYKKTLNFMWINRTINAKEKYVWNELERFLNEKVPQFWPHHNSNTALNFWSCRMTCTSAQIKNSQELCAAKKVTLRFVDDFFVTLDAKAASHLPAAASDDPSTFMTKHFHNNPLVPIYIKVDVYRMHIMCEALFKIYPPDVGVVYHCYSDLDVQSHDLQNLDERHVACAIGSLKTWHIVFASSPYVNGVENGFFIVNATEREKTAHTRYGFWAGQCVMPMLYFVRLVKCLNDDKKAIDKHIEHFYLAELSYQLLTFSAHLRNVSNGTGAVSFKKTPDQELDSVEAVLDYFGSDPFAMHKNWTFILNNSEAIDFTKGLPSLESILLDDSKFSSDKEKKSSLIKDEDKYLAELHKKCKN
jgi:hypothetical protein